MKKCWFLLIGIWLLVGCSHVALRPLSIGFTCEIAGECNGLSFGGTVNRQTVGTMTVTLNEPSSLRGMQVDFDGRKVTLSLSDMQYTQERLPSSSAPSLLLSILDDIYYKDSVGTLEEKNGEIHGDADGIGYIVTVDAETGSILSLEVPDAELSVQFSNVQKTR